MRRDSRGIESLPVALLLGTVMGASTLAIGFACLDQTRRLNERQRAIDSFNIFVERAQMVSTGEVGNACPVELELGECMIALRGKLVQLVAGGEVIRSDVLPIPFYLSVPWLGSGTYEIGLMRWLDGKYFLTVRVV
jgi:hypothetical protein